MAEAHFRGAGASATGRAFRRHGLLAVTLGAVLLAGLLPGCTVNDSVAAMEKQDDAFCRAARTNYDACRKRRIEYRKLASTAEAARLDQYHAEMKAIIDRDNARNEADMKANNARYEADMKANMERSDRIIQCLKEPGYKVCL